MGDFEGFKSSGEEVTVDVIKIARELEVEPKDVSLLQQSHDKTFTDEVLLLVGEQ